MEANLIPETINLNNIVFSQNFDMPLFHVGHSVLVHSGMFWILLTLSVIFYYHPQSRKKKKSRSVTNTHVLVCLLYVPFILLYYHSFLFYWEDSSYPPFSIYYTLSYDSSQYDFLSSPRALARGGLDKKSYCKRIIW
jgi:hypothetical protein